jgi:hypothetical protein
MANNGTQGVGDSNGGGPKSTGGPLGGPGRPGKRLDAAQQDHGDWTGAGVPNNPFREVTSQGKGSRAKGSPANPDMS